jgi:hypothetical protein
MDPLYWAVGLLFNTLYCGCGAYGNGQTCLAPRLCLVCFEHQKTLIIQGFLVFR